MASTNNGGKEERRRRIAERGSDRMALITGRISSLPPSSPSSPMHHRQSQSVSVSAFDPNSDPQPCFTRPHSIASSAFSADFHEHYVGSVEDSKPEASIASTRLKHQEGFKYSNFDNFDTKDENEPQDSDAISKPKHQITRPKDSSINKQQPKKPSWKRHTFFSSRELNFCILASENTRALSSLIIALLVVFYYKISNNILASRPLYMVLLTDITIVIARIYREKAKVLAEREGDKGEASREGHGWGDAVKLLERGLVAYQAIRGVFIDCSIYLVIVVCGISL